VVVDRADVLMPFGTAFNPSARRNATLSASTNQYGVLVKVSG
jgi:hypothetical protein